MKFKLKNTLLALAAFALVGGVAAGGAVFAQQEAVVTRAEDAETYSYITQNKETWGTEKSGSVKKNGVTWNFSLTNAGGYNSSNYCGQQFGSSKNAGSISLTSAHAWGEETGATVYGKTKIVEIRLWLNNGSGSIDTLNVAIDGKECTQEGTVEKNSSATSYLDASLVTFTPDQDDEGVITINVATSSKAFYWCAMEIDSIKGSTIETIELGGISGNAKIGESGTLSYTALDSDAEAWEGDVTYTTSDATVIALDGDKWTALKAGAADITVTAGEKDASGNDVTDTVSVTVTDLAKPLTEISEIVLDGNVYPDVAKDLEFTYLPADTDESIVATSSDETVFTVETVTDSGEGLITITPLKEGTATLTVSGIKGEVKATKEITVIEDTLTVSLTGTMNKLSYAANESWDATGLLASGAYASGKAYTGEFNFTFDPATPALMGVGEDQTLTVTAHAESGEKKSIEQTVTVTEVTYEGLIPNGSVRYICVNHDDTVYYLHSMGDSKSPIGTTDIDEATAFIFNLVDDNEYELITFDGDYLSALNDNKGVRVGSTKDTWTIEPGESTLEGDYNFCAQNGRYLTFYDGNEDWRCYTSATAGNRGENTDVVEAEDVRIPLRDWIANYMHMNDEAYEGEGTGLCVSAKTYVTAKAALLDLSARCVDAFQNNQGQAYTDALERYLAWAAAAGDATPFAGEGIIKGSNAFLVDSESYKVMTISTIAVLLGIAGVGAMVFIAKKRKKA